MNIDAEVVCNITKQAGAAIMDIYRGEHMVEFKKDKSPLTAADKASHKTIVRELQKHYPEIPVLSEEGKNISYAIRREWRCFWLVDPLDGTKEFIKRNGEFTVNIALIINNITVMGVIYIPVQDKIYWGTIGEGAFVQEGMNEPNSISVRRPDPEKGLTVVMSRSHPSPELDEYLKTIKIAEAISAGSSLKFCAVAEGKADVYPRLGPTMEWDTGAGHAIVCASGGKVVKLDGNPLVYNKENLLNPHFIVSG
jgi:3'(2'), 5'-bisphosphate nucleotidase